MKYILYKTYKFFLKIPYFSAICVLFILMYVLPIVLITPLSPFIDDGYNWSYNYNIEKPWYFVCLIYPITETFIFQFLMYWMFRYWISIKIRR